MSFCWSLECICAHSQFFLLCYFWYFQANQRCFIEIVKVYCYMHLQLHSHWTVIIYMSSTNKTLEGIHKMFKLLIFLCVFCVRVCTFVSSSLSLHRWGAWCRFSASQDIWFRALHLEPVSLIWRGVERNLSAYVGNIHRVNLLSYRPSMFCLPDS